MFSNAQTDAHGSCSARHFYGLFNGLNKKTKLLKNVEKVSRKAMFLSGRSVNEKTSPPTLLGNKHPWMRSFGWIGAQLFGVFLGSVPVFPPQSTQEPDRVHRGNRQRAKPASLKMEESQQEDSDDVCLKREKIESRDLSYHLHKTLRKSNQDN